MEMLSIASIISKPGTGIPGEQRVIYSYLIKI